MSGVRLASPADAAGLADVLDAAFGRPGYRSAVDRLLQNNLGRLWLIEVEGRPVSAAALVCYPAVAYLGLVGTLPACQGQGLGRRIVEAALAATRLPVRLDASAKGAPLYTRMDFVTDGEIIVFAVPPAAVQEKPRPLTEDEARQVRALDRLNFGDDRGPVLDVLAGEFAGRWAVLPDNRGFALVQNASIGPVWALDDSDAVAVIARAAGFLRDGGVIAVPASRPGLIAGLRALGWVELRRLLHMRRGDHPRAHWPAAAANFHYG